MQQAVAVLALLIVPQLAWAQQSAWAPPPFSGLAPIGLPLPPIGFPLPPIGLPLSPVAPPPPSPSSATPFDGQPAHSESRRLGRADRSHGDGKFAPGPGHAIVYFGSPYFWPSSLPAQKTSPAAVIAPPEQSVITGVLRLEMEPSDLPQLYVDGEFVGTIEDVAGELALEPGTRRIEIRQPDYEPLTFDARIVAGRTITYRGALTPMPDAGVARPDDAKPPRPQTFYLIPGCYLGNIPPEQVQLPPGCEGRRVITHTP